MLRHNTASAINLALVFFYTPNQFYFMDEKFIKLVAEMRKAQKDFFKTRDSTYLKKSKALEKKVDEELQKHFINEPPKEQLHLFL